MMLADPESQPDPKTVLSLAAYFGWPKVDALRWANILPEDAKQRREPSDPLRDYQGAVDRLPLSDAAKEILHQMALQLLAAQNPPRPPAPVDASLERTVDAILAAQPYQRWSDETRQKLYQEAAELRRLAPDSWQDTFRRALEESSKRRRAGPHGALKNRQYEWAFCRTVRRLLNGEEEMSS